MCVLYIDMHLVIFDILLMLHGIVAKSPLDELKALRELKDLKDRSRDRSGCKYFIASLSYFKLSVKESCLK